LDLEQGSIDRVTYRMIKSYEVDGRSIKSDIDIQTCQRQLVSSGHLVQKGRMFISAFEHQKAA